MYVLLLIIIMLLILERILNTQFDILETSVVDKNINSFYKKDYLLTQTELKFYKLLKQTTEKLNLNLFCQVSMYEVVKCKNYKEFFII